MSLQGWLLFKGAIISKTPLTAYAWSVPERHPTATRLIEAGLRLFATDGVAGTTIVKIEAAAGLAPGSGAFYRHFRSKSELLDAAIADAEATTIAGADKFEELEMDLLEEARVIAFGTWFVFDAHRDLVLVMTREADRPSRYTHDADGWPGDGYAFVTGWLDAKVTAGELVVADTRATAVVLMDAIVNYWLQRQTESERPYGVDPDRFLDAWIELIARLRP